MKSVRARRNEASPNKISFDKHSPFTDRTQRSACEFKLGLRAGSGIGFMPPAVNVARNTEHNFVSRSCNTHRADPGIPQLSPVALRAIGWIHPWSGRRLIPAKLTNAATPQMNEE